MHECPYCYVQRGWAARHYQGPPRLEEKELRVNYGSGKTIFLEHCSDLFGPMIYDEWVTRIVAHTNLWPRNTYIIQTKNPERMVWALRQNKMLPTKILGTTIETNRETPGHAPQAKYRASWISEAMKLCPAQRFVTVEPIMDFDLDEFAQMLINIHPDFINLGADSKGCGLPEPGRAKLLTLIDKLRSAGIEVRQKDNLGRLLV